MRKSTSLSFVLVWSIAAGIFAGSAYGQNAPQRKPAPGALQSACSDTMRDVDRIACWVSAGPEPLPPGSQRPSPPLLRGSGGTTIIGPKPSQ
jgi:hypothetical protein